MPFYFLWGRLFEFPIYNCFLFKIRRGISKFMVYNYNHYRVYRYHTR